MSKLFNNTLAEVAVGVAVTDIANRLDSITDLSGIDFVPDTINWNDNGSVQRDIVGTIDGVMEDTKKLLSGIPASLKLEAGTKSNAVYAAYKQIKLLRASMQATRLPIDVVCDNLKYVVAILREA